MNNGENNSRLPSSAQTDTGVNYPAWLNQAVFYQIYPQSYYDTNGDGIGDIQVKLEGVSYGTFKL
jgi:hypothetical protein